MHKTFHFLTFLVLLINGICFLSFDLAHTNFTGLLPSSPFLVSLWTLGSSGILLFQLFEIAKKLNQPTGKMRLVCSTSFLCCLFSLLLPYNTTLHPWASGFHLLFSYGFFLSISLLFLMLLLQFYWQNPKQARQIVSLYAWICLLGGCLFMHYLSINGLFEVLYTCGLALCIGWLNNALPR